jgi:glutamate-1-semialdehyde 2,1-aminomutase
LPKKKSKKKSIDRSKTLYQESQRWMPGGVSSPVRSFQAVGGDPLFITRGKGSKIYDIDGNSYVDYVSSWGPLILGHAHPRVVSMAKKALEKGTSFGTPTELEIILARMIREAMPSIEMIRFVNSGTEAAMSALRVARAYTNRTKVIKFEGCYHGHSDSFLVKAGSGVATLGLPDSPGVHPGLAHETLTATFNSLSPVDALFQEYPEEIACVIVEPVAGNMGVIPPSKGFLEGLRIVTMDHGALLVFDEVITGFRVAYGGAQELYDIEPDITCLGKIIGGGFPVGAYGGRKEIMEWVAPEGPVYQAGTLSGNPLAMTAGIETLSVLTEEDAYKTLGEHTTLLTEGLKDRAREAGLPISINQAGSMFTLFFRGPNVVDYQTAQLQNIEFYRLFFHKMLELGFYFPPSPFESSFVSLAHSKGDLEETIEKAEDVFQAIAKI